jgi:NitT/TauT family transport system permease protein
MENNRGKRSDSVTKRFLRKLLVLLIWVGLWFFAAVIVNKEVVLPTPAAVAAKLFSLACTGEFYTAISFSVLRIFAGLLAGALLGLLFGVLCASFAPADEFISPALSVVRATPVASFIILALVLMDKAYIPILISLLMVLPVIFGNIKTGILKTDAKLLEMARFFRVEKWTVITKIYAPQVAPYFFSGLKTCLGLAWKAGVAAEVLCYTKRSIGLNLQNSKTYLLTDELFAWTVTIIVISMLIEALVSHIISKYEGKRG